MDLPLRGDDEWVEVVTMGTDTLRLRTQMARPGYLVVDDLMSPGCEARVDAEPARILRTNGLFRGLLLGNGQHVVEFAYHPPRLVLGLALTGVSCGVLVVLVLCPVRRRPARANGGAEEGT